VGWGPFPWSVRQSSPNDGLWQCIKGPWFFKICPSPFAQSHHNCFDFILSFLIIFTTMNQFQAILSAGSQITSGTLEQENTPPSPRRPSNGWIQNGGWCGMYISCYIPPRTEFIFRWWYQSTSLLYQWTWDACSLAPPYGLAWTPTVTWKWWSRYLQVCTHSRSAMFRCRRCRLCARS
jgi:hypothetical protein